MKKAQVILEYSLVIGLVLAALLAMQLYAKRGIQAVIKIASDEIGSQTESENIPRRWQTEQDSTITSHTRGASPGSANLPQGATQRVSTYGSGRQRTYIDITTTTSGQQESRREIH